MTEKFDQGFASMQFLFMLIFISSLFFGLGLYLNAYTRFEYRAKERINAIMTMEEIIDIILKDLSLANDPEIDCYEDPIWSWNERTQNGFLIKINPISDKLNLNYLGKNILERSNLQHLLNPGSKPDEFQQFRYDAGFSLFKELYLQYFTQEILDGYFTCYGWANINIIEELTAMNLAYSLTESKDAAERMRIIVQDIRLNQKPITRESLKARLGNDYTKLFPYFNAEPTMNVNFLPPPILKALITYPAFGIFRAEDKYEEIMERRNLHGISQKEILEVLNINANSPLTNYLGSVTWFWEITITGEHRSARNVLCRIPNSQHGTELPRYVLIEQRYE